MNDKAPLSGDWSESAVTAARSLGLDVDSSKLPPEHWQRVLAAVETRMRMRGIEPPAAGAHRHRACRRWHALARCEGSAPSRRSRPEDGPAASAAMLSLPPLLMRRVLATYAGAFSPADTFRGPHGGRGTAPGRREPSGPCATPEARYAYECRSIQSTITKSTSQAE